MTTGAEIAQETSVSESDGDTLYAINERTYEDVGESYMFKVWQRLCWSGECRLCRIHPEGKPIVPGRTTERSIYNAARICPNKIQFHNSGNVIVGGDFPHLDSQRQPTDEIQRNRGQAQGTLGHRISATGRVSRIAPSHHGRGQRVSHRSRRSRLANVTLLRCGARTGSSRNIRGCLS